MIIDKSFPRGGVFLYEPFPVALGKNARSALLEKWDAANYDGEVDEIISSAEKIASPKAFIQPARVTSCDESGALISVVAADSDLRLTGALISEKLTAGATVAATVATCGLELHEFAVSQSDPLLREVADDICIAYLHHASHALREYAREHVFCDAHFSTLSPGSLPSWDITHQAELFALLAASDGAEKCGVRLTPSFLMIPYKSGSGLFFQTDSPFESCMRCPRPSCPNRRAEYCQHKQQN